MSQIQSLLKIPDRPRSSSFSSLLDTSNIPLDVEVAPPVSIPIPTSMGKYRVMVKTEKGSMKEIPEEWKLKITREKINRIEEMLAITFPKPRYTEIERETDVSKYWIKKIQQGLITCEFVRSQ